MNKVILMGRLTRDPDVRYSGSGDGSMCIARFTVAVDRRRTSPDGQREADFISCVAFSRLAEFAEKYLHQGTKIALTGRIQTGSYTNREGQKVYTTDVVAEDIEFAESKAANDNRQGNYQNYGGRDQQSGQQYHSESRKQEPVSSPREYEHPFADESAVGQGFMNIPEGVEDEGLPFN